MTDHDLFALVGAIRIGTHRKDIDALSVQSDGMLNASSLVFDAKNANWPYSQKKPCSIRFDSDDRVSFVNFEPGAAGLPGLDAEADEHTVRQRFPDHTDRFQTESAKRAPHVSLILGTSDDDVVMVCSFTSGRQTGVGFWLKKNLEAQGDAIRAHEQTILREAEEKAAKLAKAEADRAAYVAWRRSAPPDEVLRHWAKTYSARGEGPSEWQQFADWLIEESTPFDRHLLLRGYNWDHGVDVPNWIIRQPDTQLATVLTIFWAAEPSFYIDCIARNQPIPRHAEDGYGLLLDIGKNVASGFYKSPWPWQRIAYTCEARATWNMSDPDVARAARLLVPDCAALSIIGKDATKLAARRVLPFDAGILA